MPQSSDKSRGLLDDIPSDIDALTVVQETQLIGRFIWELTGRSLFRLIVTFVAVFVACFVPSLLLILGLTVTSQTYTRSGLLLMVILCLIPIGGVMSFNYVTYRGIRNVVEKLAFGQKLGAGFVAMLKPTGRLRLPLTDFTDRLKSYLTKTRREAQPEHRGVRRLFFRAVNSVIFYTARFVLNRIAKGCIIDGEVDLELFAKAVGERADGMLIAYLKKVLWDLTRLLLSIAVIVLWILIVIVTQLVKIIS